VVLDRRLSPRFSDPRVQERGSGGCCSSRAGLLATPSAKCLAWGVAFRGSSIGVWIVTNDEAIAGILDQLSGQPNLIWEDERDPTDEQLERWADMPPPKVVQVTAYVPANPKHDPTDPDVRHPKRGAPR
jgi:hypothetical protein